MRPEERLAKLEEAMLVNASLMTRMDQNVDRLVQTVDHMGQRVDQLGQRVEQLVQVGLSHEDGIAELRQSQLNLNSAMNALFGRMDGLTERLDKFIRGLEGNGRKQ